MAASKPKRVRSALSISLENIIRATSFTALKGKKASGIFLDAESQKLMKDVNKSRASKKDSFYELKLKNKSGKIREVVISGITTLDKYGKAKGSVGIHWDVTASRDAERKLHEERLGRSEKLLRGDSMAR